MLAFDPKNNTERENYKLLIGTIIPRPIAFITTLAEDGIINGAPFSYFNIVSSNPPMISVSIQRKNGQLKDTARNIRKNKEFVVHIVDEDNVKQINETAASLSPNESELAIANLTQVKSNLVQVPGIREAKVRFECTLEHAVELGENGSVGVDMIVGKVLQFHIDEAIYYENGRINPAKLGAVSRLAGSNYAKIGDMFSIERPK